MINKNLPNTNTEFIKNNSQTIKSNITLISPKGNLYNEIQIFSKNGKHYAITPNGEHVFLNNGLKLGTQIFYFKEIEGNYVLTVEQEGINYYFLENGEKYTPKSFKEKIIPGFKKVVNNIL